MINCQVEIPRNFLGSFESEEQKTIHCAKREQSNYFAIIRKKTENRDCQYANKTSSESVVKLIRSTPIIGDDNRTV